MTCIYTALESIFSQETLSFLDTVPIMVKGIRPYLPITPSRLKLLPGVPCLPWGKDQGKIYLVEPMGPIEDDPNLTDKKFPGNPTKSYRSRDRLKHIGEVLDWQGHSPEQLKSLKGHLEELKGHSIEAIDV